MRITLKCQVGRHKKQSQTFTPRELQKANMEYDVEQAALVHSLVREVQAIVPITHDILREHFVRLCIENSPWVHLEVPSVLASRGLDFQPQELQVLKVLIDSHCAPQNIPIIDAMTKLKDSQASIAKQEWAGSEMRGGGAESGPTHNRLNMSYPTAKMTGSSKVDGVWLPSANQVR